jgi:hypothetical protein
MPSWPYGHVPHPAAARFMSVVTPDVENISGKRPSSVREWITSASGSNQTLGTRSVGPLRFVSGISRVPHSKLTWATTFDASPRRLYFPISEPFGPSTAVARWRFHILSFAGAAVHSYGNASRAISPAVSTYSRRQIEGVAPRRSDLLRAIARIALSARPSPDTLLGGQRQTCQLMALKLAGGAAR